MNIDLIPCEICCKQFPPNEYIIHITTHTPNDYTTNISSNHSNHSNYSNTNHSNASISSPTIPCDKCFQQIPLNEYDSHLLMHSLSNNNANTNTNTNSIITSPTIPCSNCNQQIPISNYETHQLTHISDTNPSINPSSNSQLIPCEYSNCTTKWIPSHEYNDHITLHKLQSQQAQPNTSNDEIIALHTQTQLIKQQTTTDPRRICLSNSFIHLSNTQRPVIPMHDTLITNINNNSNRNNNILGTPPRDTHNVSYIIESLEHILSKRSHIEYYLCNSLTFYYRNREDYSWGCGFRNCIFWLIKTSNQSQICV